MPTNYLPDASFKASQVFAKDIAVPPGAPLPVNTIFEPVLYQLYLRDQRTLVEHAPPAPAKAL